MKEVSAAIGLLFALLLPSMAIAQYQCDATVCVLPNCHCASTDPPGGLLPAETPQFILVTFDDAIHTASESLIRTFMQGLTNSDGRLAPLTYFTNAVSTIPEIARSLYEAGHELANHSATHTTGTETSLAIWRNEIDSLFSFMLNEVGIPRDQIVGFRAPYLKTNPALWRVLKETEMLYESSIPEQVLSPPLVSTGLDAYVWPHTLDYGSALSCLRNECPEFPIPGLWSIPMWDWMDREGTNHGAMDPTVFDSDLFRDVLDYNFQRRYRGNRAPLGLYLHAVETDYQGRPEVLRSFLAETLSRPDVWMITMRGLIEWMRDPVPASEMTDWFARGCDRGQCRETSNTRTEVLTTSTPRYTTTVYPNPTRSNAVLEYESASTGIVAFELINLLGRVIYTEKRKQDSKRITFSLPLAGSANGLYLYRITDANGLQSTGTVIKLR